MAALFPKMPIENHLSTLLLPGPETVFGKELYPQKNRGEDKTNLLPLERSVPQCHWNVTVMSSASSGMGSSHALMRHLESRLHEELDPR